MDTSRNVLLAAGGATLALVVGVAAISGGDESETPAVAASSDAGLVEDAVFRTSFEHHVSDLDSAIVEPGAEAISSVNLPRGGRVTNVAPTTPFSVLDVTYEDHADSTRVVVKVRSHALTPLRFAATFEYDAPPQPEPLP